ncbi:MAG TPA: hypothetical protein VF152_13860 [Acidimicrobiia bacterium]
MRVPSAPRRPPVADKGDPLVKKLLILLILVAIGIAVAKKVREV